MMKKYIMISLLLGLGVVYSAYAGKTLDKVESEQSESILSQCASSDLKPNRLVREPVPEHLKYIERPKEFKPLDDRILGDVENNKCIPVKDFKGGISSNLIVVFDTMEQCEELRKQVTTLEAEDITLSCRFGRKPYRCCEAIPWNPYCVRTCATGCAWNRTTAAADCLYSCPGEDNCLRYDGDARKKCAWD